MSSSSESSEVDVGVVVRWGASALLLFALVAIVAVAHLRQRGETAIRECDKALAASDGAASVAWARDAAMAVAPESPYPAQGLDRLEAIAGRAEERGDFDLAIQAWRAVRVALVSTRREDEEAPRMDEAARALVRLARRACEGNTSRPPAVCAAAAEATLRESRLPPLPRFEWLAVGALAFLGGGAAALFGASGRRLLPALVSASGAIVAAVTLLTR